MRPQRTATLPLGVAAALTALAACASIIVAVGSVVTFAGDAKPDRARIDAPRIDEIVLYRPGLAWNEGRPLEEQPAILAEHAKYLAGFAARGNLIYGGPFDDATGALGVFRGLSHEEVRALLRDDPAVKAGVLQATVTPIRVAIDAAAAAK